MRKEAAEQENERKQHRNQIKQIWNFTADEQENRLHTHTHPGSTFVYMYVIVCVHTCSYVLYVYAQDRVLLLTA